MEHIDLKFTVIWLEMYVFSIDQQKLYPTLGV